MDKGFVILTEIELEKLCGRFFNRGYYSAFHKADRKDRSVEIYQFCKTEFLKDILARSKDHDELEIETVEQLLKQRSDIEDKILSIDPNALIAKALEDLNKDSLISKAIEDLNVSSYDNSDIKTPKPNIKSSPQKTYSNEPRQIVLNRGICKSCGDHLISHHRHDYVSCSCGKSFLDGGTDYVRAGGNIETNTVYDDDDFKIVRCSAERGGRGKNGDEPLTYTKICDMSDEWLESVLNYGGNKWHLDIIRKEIEFRNPTLRSFRIGDNIEYKDVRFRLISNYYPDTMMFDTDHPDIKTVGYTDLVEYGKII